MHARIDHLLSIRDGEPVDAGMAEHVEQCVTCSEELRRLSSMRAQLQALPQLDAPVVAWEQIRQQAARPRAPRLSRKVGVAAAMLVMLSIVVVIAVREGDEGRAGVAGVRTEDAPSQPSPAKSGGGGEEEQKEEESGDEWTHVEALMAQSQHLDYLLQKLPERPRVERVSTAATIDTIEQRIQWLDFQLSYASDSGLSEAQSRQLWRERVELMDSLVKVRYAEAGRSSF